MSDTGKAMRDSVFAMADLLRQYAREGEELGVLAPATVQAMHKAGLFKITLPIELGGYALGARDTVEIVDALGGPTRQQGGRSSYRAQRATLSAFPKSKRRGVRHRRHPGSVPSCLALRYFRPKSAKAVRSTAVGWLKANGRSAADAGSPHGVRWESNISMRKPGIPGGQWPSCHRTNTQFSMIGRSWD